MPSKFSAWPRANEVRLCVTDDQVPHLPQGQPVPTLWPRGAPLPRDGEVIYLTSTSAWVVRMVIHEFLPGGALRHELWIEWVGAARHCRHVDVSNCVH